ncbi:MAG TPA: fasciclin domain-containing protein [Gemmatimonadaceae bacterium]|nr:fasciclin domain-containing protein [Gemmatimonadaceae bacterium]
MKSLFRTTFVAAAVTILPNVASAQAPTKNIVETAVAAGSFNTLVAAVQAAGLVETLSGKGPFTVFAPSDAAFAKLPAGTIDALLKDKAALSAILTYHVVPGKIMAADVLKMKSGQPATVNGQKLNVVVRDGKVFVDGAQVVTTDIVTTNGVIHVIDSVVLPKGK